MPNRRDVMLAAPDELDSASLSPRFEEARALIHAARASPIAGGIADATLATVLTSEAVLRLVGAYGPGAAARILAMFAACLDGAASSARQ